MDVLRLIGDFGILPVIEPINSKNAIPVSRALLKSRINVVEITCNSSKGIDFIRTVSAGCPDICLGAGGIYTPEQAKSAVAAGAGFILSPGFNRELIDWCHEENISLIPCCTNSYEFEEAENLGLSVVGIAGESNYADLSGVKMLVDTFPNMKFIPALGSMDDNLDELLKNPNIYAVRISLPCSEMDISESSLSTITARCNEARRKALGYSFAHLGINCPEPEMSSKVCESFSKTFDFSVRDLGNSNFVSANFEVMKKTFPGEHGHIAIRTANIRRAIADMDAKGIELDMETAGYRNGAMISVYLKESIGGFAIHLLQI